MQVETHKGFLAPPPPRMSCCWTELVVLLQPRRMEVIIYSMSIGAYLLNCGYLSNSENIADVRGWSFWNGEKVAKFTMPVVCHTCYKRFKGYLEWARWSQTIVFTLVSNGPRPMTLKHKQPFLLIWLCVFDSVIISSEISSLWKQRECVGFNLPLRRSIQLA